MIHIDAASNATSLVQLLKNVSDGYIRSQRHTSLPLTIYNYTPAAVYDSHWNSATLMARGLILDDDGMIVARPFKKFFNLGERPTPKLIADRPARIFEKSDGSLGILYEYNGHVAVATRGSFSSDQAIWATDWLNKMKWADGIGSSLFKFWPDEVTPLVEIIYPENRIVVDYRGAQKLIMLGAVRHSDGSDSSTREIEGWWPFSFAGEEAPSNVQEIACTVNSDNYEGCEGVVMVWYHDEEPSYRLKVKREDYVVLHRIVTGMTARRVWEMAKEKMDVEEILQAGVPEEFSDWVRNKYQLFVSDHASRTQEILDGFTELSTRASVMKNNGRTIDRKKFAKAAKSIEGATSYMFALLDGKNIEEKVWEEFYPAHEVPFS